MLKRLLRRPPRSLAAQIDEELLSLCRANQIEQLSLSPHLRRDVGLDCGCRTDRPAI